MAYDKAIERERFTHEGREFEVAFFADDDHEPPWESSDGHGPVRFLSYREALEPGETILAETRHGRYAYNIREAIAQSIREGWGRPDKETRERVALYTRKPAAKVTAIDADMHFLRGWCNESWCYIGVSVRIIGPDDEPEGDDYDNAIWGVESCGEYRHELAREIAGEILHKRRADWRKALHERREARYWATRDVQTAGA